VRKRRATRSIDGYQLDIENQRAIGRNAGAGTLFSIPQSGRYHQLPRGPARHQLQRFAPAGNHLVDPEAGGLVALVGTIELGAIDEAAPVMHEHLVGRPGFLATAGLDDPVLQAAFRCDDPRFAGIFGAKFLAGIFQLCQLLLSCLVERNNFF
jgi:hypothetical protein